jgi:hypothetical protein
MAHSTSLIYCIQIAGVFNEADVSGILLFSFGIASVALAAR